MMKRAMTWTCSLCLLALFVAGCGQTTIDGPGGKKLTLKTPWSVDIERGGTAQIDVGIERTKTDEPVTVSIGQLPRGVSARQTTKTVETDSVVFILEADSDAALVSNHAVAITLQGPEGMKGTRHVRLSVGE
jgi:hypothetical protein